MTQGAKRIKLPAVVGMTTDQWLSSCLEGDVIKVFKIQGFVILQNTRANEVYMLEKAALEPKRKGDDE